MSDPVVFANTHLWPYVKAVDSLSPQQVDSLVVAANANAQIFCSHAFAGGSQNGMPLTELLMSLTGRKYKFVNQQWLGDEV